MDVKIAKKDAARFKWGNTENGKGVTGLNYKFPSPGISILTAELREPHGEVRTKDSPRPYYILEGAGEFQIEDKIISVVAGDALVVPANAKFDYWPTSPVLKVMVVMEMWNSKDWEYEEE